MSTPSSWPSPQNPPGPPSPYGQPYAQPYGQVPQGGYAAQPVPYGQQAPMPYQAPPRPERPLMPGVWWSLVINLVVTFLMGLVVLLIGWAFIELITGAVGEDVSWSQAAADENVGAIVGVVAVVLVLSLLVSWLLTVGALILWRLIRGFRTIPTFVQALVAYVSMWVVTSLLSFVLQMAFGVFGAMGGGSSTF